MFGVMSGLRIDHASIPVIELATIFTHRVSTNMLNQNKYAAIAVVAYSALFIVMGLAYAAAPAQMFSLTGNAVLDVSSTIDVLATYGGVQMAIGLYALTEWRKSGDAPASLRLFGHVLLMVGLLRGIGGLWHGDSIDLIYFLPAVSEVIGALVAYKLAR